MRKGFLFIVLFALFVCVLGGGLGMITEPNSPSQFNQSLSAESTDEPDIQEELDGTVDEQLNGFDFDGLQSILDGLSDEGRNIFGSGSFWDKLNRLLSGDFGDGYGGFFQAILAVLFEEFVALIPMLATIVVVTILGSIISGIKSKESEGSVGQIIEFVCFGVVVVIVSAVVIGLLQSSVAVVQSIQTQMNLIFPILLTLLAGVGGTVSAGIFQPAVAILSGVIVNIFLAVIVPLFVFLFVFVVVGHLSPSVKLDKFISFISSIFKWTAGICFSVFLGVLMVHGIVAGSFDSVSIRATRFAIKSYIPILGGYLSDGFNLIMASSVIIKNVVGLAGILLLFASVLTPIIQIIVSVLLLRLTAAILEPVVGAGRIPEFLQKVAKTLNLLVMIVAGVAFMYVITIGMILCTANVV